MGRWVEREHTADALLTVWGDDLADLFATAARATFALISPWGEGEPLVVRITLSAPDVETLLVDWLNELLYHAEGERLLTFRTFRIHRLTEREMEATVEGREVKGWRTYVKAATFHNLRVRREPEGYRADITFDL